MNLLALPEFRELVFELLGPELRPEDQALFDIEWRQFERRAARLGLEVLDCEDSGLDYADGARRPGDWPLLARAHYGILDLLHQEIDRELVDNVRRMLERARVLDMQGFGQDLLLASAHEHTPASALVRFGIYELIRVNLWMLSWDAPEVEALGAMTEIDHEAQRILGRRLRDSSMYVANVRPLFVLVTEAFVELAGIARKLSTLVRAGSPALRRFFEGLTAATRLARKLGPADASVLRNEYAEHVGDERLGSLMLSERHPTFLPSPQAVDTRRCRLVAAVRDGRRAQGQTRFVELAREVYFGSQEARRDG